MDPNESSEISNANSRQNVRKLIKDMREIADVTDEENTGVTPGAKAAAAALGEAQEALGQAPEPRRWCCPRRR
jgi:ribosomal protein L19E